MRKKTTLINETARKRLGITRDEYALCAYIHYRIADPNNGKPGWCSDTREEIAEFVGITRRGLLKMVTRMADVDLLEVGGTGALRVGETWIKEENAWELSSQSNGNLVPNKRELSSQSNGNLVPKVNKGDNKEERERVSESAHAQISSTLKTETTHPTPPSSAPPPAPKSGYLFEDWINEITTNYQIREAFGLTYKIPVALFDDFAARFQALARTAPEKYTKRSDLTGHFLSWSNIQYKSNKPTAINPGPALSNIPTYGR